jgi:hypothetical protein
MRFVTLAVLALLGAAPALRAQAPAQAAAPPAEAAPVPAPAGQTAPVPADPVAAAPVATASAAPALESPPAPPAGPDDADIFRGETIVVTPDPGFGDFAPWRKAIEAALAKAPLKQRSELTQHDLEQILILRDDVPKLRRALDDMARVIDANPKQSMLTGNEKLELMRAYLVTQSILMNVPDELMIACRQRNRPGQRNEELVCEFDYARAEEMMRHVGSAFRTSMHKPNDAKRRFREREVR